MYVDKKPQLYFYNYIYKWFRYICLFCKSGTKKYCFTAVLWRGVELKEEHFNLAILQNHLILVLLEYLLSFKVTFSRQICSLLCKTRQFEGFYEG